MGLTKPRAHQLQDIDYKQTARAVTTSNITLSGGAPATVDGVSLALRDRVLVTAQSTGSENGIYYVTTVGAGSNGTWARSLDANETGEIKAGTIIMITEGTTYADTQWKLTTDDPITVGSTTMTFVRAGNAAYGTIAVAGQNSIVADQIGDTLTMVAGTNLALTTNDSTDTLTVTPSLTPTLTSLSLTGGEITSTSAITIHPTTSNTDIVFRGNDGGATITALTLDMSVAGTARFNNGVEGSYFWGSKTTDDAVTVYAGANFEIRLTHVHNTGFVLTNSGTGTPAVELQFVDANESIGSDGTNLLLTSGGSEITVPASAGNMVVDSATQTLTNKTLTSPTINAFSGTGNGSITGTLTLTNTTTDDSLLITTTEDSSSAAPVITLKRNSASVADADYLGQIKFKGENDADQEVVYAKITAKIQDASDTTEDGLIEFANRKAGSNTITARLRSDSLELLNGTSLTVAGDATVTGALIADGLSYPTSDGTADQVLVTDGAGTLSFADASGGGATVSSDTSTNTNFLLYFASTTTGALTAVKQDSGLTYNPSTGLLTSAAFSGSGASLTALNGSNISTGTVAAARVATLNQNTTGTAGGLSSAVTVSLSGAVTGSATFTNAGDTASITTTATSDPTITLTGAVTGSGTLTNLGDVSIATTNTADPTITLAGDLSGSATLTNLGSATLTATIAANSVALGTDTTGNYVGTITGGTGIASSGATTGEGVAHTLSVDLSELTDMTGGMVGTDEFIVLDAGADRRKAANEIGLSIFNNDAGFTSNTGDITNVAVSGTGLSGGGASGAVTITSNATSANTGGTIVARDGSGNFSAGVITATATQARYADLAEKYTSDQDYEPGTIVELGGEYEVTQTRRTRSTAIAGVVSTDPAYLMNSDSEGISVALIGRVPCKVVGKVRKGDLLISSDEPGHAQAYKDMHNPPTGSVIGKAIESKDNEETGVIEVLVGRL